MGQNVLMVNPNPFSMVLSGVTLPEQARRFTVLALLVFAGCKQPGDTVLRYRCQLA